MDREGTGLEFPGLTFTADLTASRRKISRLKVGMITENNVWFIIMLQPHKENFKNFRIIQYNSSNNLPTNQGGVYPNVETLPIFHQYLLPDSGEDNHEMRPYEFLR